MVATIRHLRFGASLLLGLTALAVFLAPTGSAIAAPRAASSGLLLTVAARECPTYADITANKSRNDIMESLRDLGPDAPYEAGEVVNPEVEKKAQPECKPLAGWSFTLGAGYVTKAVTGPWGSLSIIKGQLREPVVTKKETPLLNARGEATGEQIGGAVTIELGAKEAGLAPGGSLWIQGGTPADPILDEVFPGPEYGFGALRCATDNVNGDNVEYVQYPTGATHVFCFAYYVKPPPTSGTIVIRKRAIGDGAPAEAFSFAGNVSYDPGGHFTLSPPRNGTASETFFRGATAAGEAPWRIVERGAVDWLLAALTCASANGTSQVVTQDAEARIRLAGEDTVTCTYTDEYSPPPQGLLIRKVSEGGTARFRYSVKPAGGGEEHDATATTEHEGIAVDASPAPLRLDAGHYRIIEHLPDEPNGHWKLTKVECGGRKRNVDDDAVTVKITAREVETCTFHNRFVPAGSIAISKVTHGAVGTTGFAIEPFADPAGTLSEQATTKEEGVAVKAHGDPSDHLELGRYVITESPPPPGKGEWELVEVRCNGEVQPFAQGRIEVKLTAHDPHQHCTFVNQFHRRPEPPPGPPQPEDPARLVIAKRLLTRHPEAGELIEYEIRVRNAGRGDSVDTVVVDEPLGRARLVFARPSSGNCREGLPVVCELGTLAAGATATVRVGIIAGHRGRLVNRAIAGTASPEQEVAGAEAQAAAKVRPSRPTESPVPGLG